MKPATTPVLPQERFEVLDALRGFAILGIFTVNMIASSATWGAPPEARLIQLGAADDYFDRLLQWLIEGKFYTIFSILFGLGFGLQLERSLKKGVNGLGLFKRRLWGLLLIGLAHMFLLWMGDILFLYAWLGFVLILFRRRRNRFLLIGAAVCLMVPVMLYPLRLINQNITLAAPFYLVMLQVGKAMGWDVMKMDFVAALNAPDWLTYFKTNVIAFFFRQADLFDQVRPFKVLAAFFLGYWASRHTLYAYPMKLAEMAKKWLWPVFFLALVLNFFMAYIDWNTYYKGEWSGFYKTAFYALGVVPLAICYVVFFVHAYAGTARLWLFPFTYIGRTALTNYLLQSVVYVILFRGPFLGLAGKIGPILCMVPVLVIFPLQVLVSRWWLSRYQFGPAEWLWRTMTYGKKQPMRRSKEITLPTD